MSHQSYQPNHVHSPIQSECLCRLRLMVSQLLLGIVVVSGCQAVNRLSIVEQLFQ